jgi:hypothetical protein
MFQSKPVVEATNSLSFSKATNASTRRSSTLFRLLKTSLANHFSRISSQDMLHGVELRTVRRQRLKPYIFRHSQVIGPVPASPIQEHQDKLFWLPPRYFF